ALDALRARRRRRRKRAGVDPVGPLGKEAQRALSIEPADIVDHVRARLPDLYARLPGIDGALEMAERRRHRAGRRFAQLLTGVAAVGLDDVEPLALGFQGLGDAVALGAGAGELARRRNLQQRIPVERRVVLRRRLGVGRQGGVEVDGLAERALYLRTVD